MRKEDTVSGKITAAFCGGGAESGRPWATFSPWARGRLCPERQEGASGLTLKSPSPAPILQPGPGAPVSAGGRVGPKQRWGPGRSSHRCDKQQSSPPPLFRLPTWNPNPSCFVARLGLLCQEKGPPGAHAAK